ncbi:peptidase S8/S53 domain-containing protein [Podospora fimiseda]|uniref:Peptidase S8/S53 domain-containing protein n=1 Tax=Podospora fimiseda TaxID=252190 RepID=A0AAN7GVH3_9PEZI|nr:peptidase S8/S53 domain-containing protein [Podospora fimiseda]
MKFTIYAGLAGLLALPTVLAQVASVANDGVSAAVTIPDTYIVKFKSNPDATKKKKYTDKINSKKGGKKGVVESISVNGFDAAVVEIPPSELKTLLESDLVEYVEKDVVANITGVATPIEKRAYVNQLDAVWGLARISHNPTWPATRGQSNYYYDNSAGNGVRVYIIDTGIRTTHTEFASNRAVWGKNFITGSPNTDEHGHGTHVAGTVAGTKYGVAKRATVVAVKVLDKNGSGTMAGVVQGITWAITDAKNKNIAKKTVFNLSLGGGYSAAVNAAIKAATDAGITVVVAAGNDNIDAKNSSPASAPTAITVGAIEGTRTRAWWSNFGPLVDIFAPGVSILSSHHLSNTDTYYMDGTSMASPHVAGLAAYFIAKEGLSGYAAVTNRIISASIKNAVRDPKGGLNNLAYNAGGK